MLDTVQTLKRAMPYIRLYKGKTFIVKVGGALLAQPEVLAGLAEDITLLANVGIRVVLVHGGGPQATNLSKKLGIEPKIVAGRRVTDEATLEVAKMVYGGALNIDILSALRRCGTNAVGISGVDGQLITAKRREKTAISPAPGEPEAEVDFGLVGDIEKVNPALLEHLLAGDQVPVICSLGCDDEGTIFNINADSIAQAVAIAMGADKLLMLSEPEGLLSKPDVPSSLISYTDIGEIEQLKADGVVSGGMLPKVDACIGALKAGVARTHILSGTKPGALLLEIFTNAGCGTMIVDQVERKTYVKKELGKNGNGKDGSSKDGTSA